MIGTTHMINLKNFFKSSKKNHAPGYVRVREAESQTLVVKQKY
jgi:hypothetical protein